MLTIAKLSRWSIDYYNRTARAAGEAAKDAQRANGGLGEYYSERDARAPVWLCAGDAAKAAPLAGLSGAQRAGGDADPDVVARWLDDGVAPNGRCSRAMGARSVHGFDLTFCAPKSVSLIRAVGGDDVMDKAVADAHATALTEAMEYLARHAGYTRVHNAVTGEKDLVRLPGLVAIAYQHETSRAGDPHLHTHVIVPNRQPRADGRLVSIDGTSLYHEVRAAGVIYQATLRRELNHSLGVEWAPVDEATGMAEVAGVDPATVSAWSRRRTQLREWAANNLVLIDGAAPSQAQLAAAQKATRPAKPEQLAWAQLRAMWADDVRGLRLDRGAHTAAREARLSASRAAFDRARLVAMAAKIDKPAFTRADLVELIGAQSPIDGQVDPRAQIEAAVDAVAIRLTAPRAAHQREGHERFTVDYVLGEEVSLLNLIDARDARSEFAVGAHETAPLSPEQAAAVRTIAASPWLVQPLQAPAGAGKTTSMRALHLAARRAGKRVVALAPTGQAVDVAVRDGAADVGYTLHKALGALRAGQLAFDARTLAVLDEAGMAGTPQLRELLAATTAAGAKTVLVGDAHQLAPVRARGGMFAQLCNDLPWSQRLTEVWRMRDPAERTASLGLRDGGPAPVRRAVEWYRRQDRLHTGDPIAMAADALGAYRADVAAGKDALLIADTWELCDALNKRIHDDTIPADAPTVKAARGHRIAAGDIIITRENNPTIRADDAQGQPADPVRNGNRWRVFAIDHNKGWVAARRLGDGARTLLAGDYLRRHVTHGYASTVHASQGITAETVHAVLGENTSRATLYVAMTRGRESNTTYLYERMAGEGDHEHADPRGVHVMRRGTSREAATLVRAIIANRDDRPQTAHDVAACSSPEDLPPLVKRLVVQRRANAVQRRRATYQQWREETQEQATERQRWIDQQIRRDRGKEHALDTGFDL
jgi:conjugative relaxase-like TrwC/TraI family protein